MDFDAGDVKASTSSRVLRAEIKHNGFNQRHGLNRIYMME